MTDKKDGPGPKDGPAKAGERATSEPAPGKRPFATIDLKAVEVAGGAAKPAGETATPASAASPEASSPKAPTAAHPRAQADAARSVAAAAAAVSQRNAGAGDPKATLGANAATAPRAAPDAPPSGTTTSHPTLSEPVAPTPPVSRGGVGSHALAGLLGAGVALLLSPFIVPALTPVLEDAGLLPPAAVSPEVARRLGELEKKAAAPPAPVDPARDPSRAIAASEATGKRVDAVQQQLAAVGDAQAKSQRTLADLEARLAKDPGIPEVGNRLVNMEQQLSELGRAAREEPDRAGRIPQLVQMTGRIADLEAALGTRMTEARKDTSREIETRLAPVMETAETTRSSMQRLDREVGTLKAETNKLATGLDDVKTGSERLQLALKAARDETAQLASSLDTARRDLEGRLKTDVGAAVAPLATQIGALEKNLTTVVKSEDERNATAERIVLSLELGNLKRAMERGAPYARELGEVAKVAGPRIDLAALQKYRDEGVPTLAELSRGFRPIAHAALDAEAEKTDGSVVDRLVSGARTFVRVRKTTHAAGDKSPEAAVARIEDALRNGRLSDVLSEMKTLDRKPASASEWVAKVEARQTVDVALKAIDDQLKASLGGGPATPAATPKKGQP